MTSWFGGVVAVVDLAAGTVKQTISVRVHNHNVALRPDKRQAWVTNNNAGTVSVIDTLTDSIVNTITMPKAPEGIAIKQ
ncbi:MAG: YncE family protein [Methylosarcina sp.]